MKQISSSGGISAKILIVFIALLLGFAISRQHGLFLVLIIPVYLLIITYICIQLYYNPLVSYDNSSVSFKKFNKERETIPFTDLIAIDANPQMYQKGGNAGTRDYYKIWYYDMEGNRRKVNFYMRRTKLHSFQEMMRLIKIANNSFGKDNTIFTVK